MTHIELSGAFAIFTIILWVIVALIGISGLLLAAYHVIDYTLRQTLNFFKMLDLFRMFMIQEMRKKNNRSI